MKKIIGVLLVVALAFGMTGLAQAAPSTLGGEQVFIQTDSTVGIPAGSCAALSTIILGMSGNVTLVAGDVGQFNLPPGVNLCKDIDFFVGNSQARITTGVFGQFGPVDVFKTVATSSGGGIYVRVQGTTGSQSVVLSVIGENTQNWVKLHGGDKELSVRLRLFSRAIWAGAVTQLQYAANRNSTWLYTDGNNDGIITSRLAPVNDAPMTTIGVVGDKNDDNACCIQTPANWTSLVTASFESQDILNPGVKKWDFTNDPNFEAGDSTIPVASILASTAFECLPICKVDDWDYVPIVTVGQAAGSCVYDYNTGLNYCNTVTAVTGTAGWPGQKLAIKKTANFNSGDYELVITIDGDGTSFNIGSTPAVQAYGLGTSNDNVCTTAGANVVDAIYWFTQTGPATTTAAADVDCDVQAINAMTRVVIDLGALNPYAILGVTIPLIQYTLADVVAGDEVEVTLDLRKKPCGTIFTCTEKVAEYIASCGMAAGPCDPFTLPYFPPINDAVWWSGAALSNCSSGGATCTLNFYESDGDWGTYTQTLGAWGQWSGLWTSISANIVPDAGNAGSLGDATFFVCICCQPGAGGPAGSPVSALGMMGTGDQSHGYDVNSW